MKLLRLFWIAGLLAACAYEDGPYRVIDGKCVTDELVSHIRGGSTTAEEVRSLFGRPRQVNSTPSAETWTYGCVRERVVTERRLLVRRRFSETSSERLLITFSKGVVVNHVSRTTSKLAPISPER